MDTFQILYALRNVHSFLGVYPSDILPLDKINQTGTIILNSNPHTEDVSDWLAIKIEPRSSTSIYFDSYGLSPFVPAIQSFLRRTCTIWEYNKTQLQGLTTDCGHYCWVYFVSLFVFPNYFGLIFCFCVSVFFVFVFVFFVFVLLCVAVGWVMFF
jgi:hypothetical protein